VTLPKGVKGGLIKSKASVRKAQLKLQAPRRGAQLNIVPKHSIAMEEVCVFCFIAFLYFLSV
jgi:hypothetical protein